MSNAEGAKIEAGIGREGGMGSYRPPFQAPPRKKQRNFNC